MNPASVINGSADSSGSGIGLVDLLRRTVRRATPSAARSAIPPNEPTRAGTRGTTGDGVSVVDEGVVEVLVDEGRPPAVGVAGVGGTHVKPSVEVDRVLQLNPELVVLFCRSGIVVIVPLIVSVLFKNAVGVGVAENAVVRLAGSVSTISVGLIVAEEDIGTVEFPSNELDAVASAVDKVSLLATVSVASGIEVCVPVVITEEFGELSAVAVPSTAEASVVPVSDVVRPVSMAGTTAVKEESIVSGISPEEVVGKMELTSVIGKVAVIFAIGICVVTIAGTSVVRGPGVRFSGMVTVGRPVGKGPTIEDRREVSLNTAGIVAVNSLGTAGISVTLINGVGDCSTDGKLVSVGSVGKIVSTSELTAVARDPVMDST